jgi:hypothetical protein
MDIIPHYIFTSCKWKQIIKWLALTYLKKKLQACVSEWSIPTELSPLVGEGTHLYTHEIKNDKWRVQKSIRSSDETECY